MRIRFWLAACAIGMALFDIKTHGEDKVSGTAAKDAPAEIKANFSKNVRFEVGISGFASGDKITIERMRGSSEKIAAGGTYSVEGTYTLSSHEEADLGFFTTSFGPSDSTPVRPGQMVHIKKGQGTFRLEQTIPFEGYPHVSFYAGNSFGEVYFGQGKQVLKPKPPTTKQNGRNSMLWDFLGNPVDAPTNLDARYTKSGLVKAVKFAVKRAVIKGVKSIEIAEDFEFPFLVGVVCNGPDIGALKAEIKKMDGYHSVGSFGNEANTDEVDTVVIFNLTPAAAYPPASAEAIEHRLLLRQQVLFDRLAQTFAWQVHVTR